MKSYVDFATGQTSGHGPEDLCLVLDTSPSMDFDDFEPSRLGGAIQASVALIEAKRAQCPGDRVGVVAFNGCARVVHPLVNVGEGANSVLKSMEDLSTDSCTNIASGLHEAEQLLLGKSSRLHLGLLGPVIQFFVGDRDEERGVSSEERPARIVLLSDGLSNCGLPPVRSARALKDRGIQIDVVGIGGSPDSESFDEDQLKKIASKGPDGVPRYCFIRDTVQLVRKFQELANHIRPL